MANSGPSSALLLILNVIHVILALAITSVGIWLFVEIQSITNMRNIHHYILDFNIYWPQGIPWIFILVGFFVICVSCCAFVGAKKKSSGFLKCYIAFEIAAVVALIIAAGVSIAFVDSENSMKFVKDVIWDGFHQIGTSEHPEVQASFETLERRLQCCGADSPRNYKSFKDLGDTFPASCCDTYYHGFIGTHAIYCESSSKEPNERRGCTEVATYYMSISVKVLSAVALFTAVIGILNIVAALSLSKRMNRNPKFPVQREPETKKVLL